MTEKAFDVEHANRMYINSLSPASRAVHGIDVSKGVACGDSRGAKLGRAAARFVRSGQEIGHSVVEKATAVVEEARNPIYRAGAVAIVDEIGAHAKIAKFKTKDALRAASRRAGNAIAAVDLKKFVSPASSLAVLGRPKVVVAALVVGALLSVGISNGVVAMSPGSTDAGYGAIGRTAEAFPIQMRQSSSGFASRVSTALPSERFEQEALASLTQDFGDETSAREHLDLALSILNTCIELPTPCTVHTAGLDLDPVHGRYLVSVADDQGNYNYSFMSYDGHDVALDGQDGDEPVKNPYGWTP